MEEELKHLCTICGEIFNSVEEYIAHLCPMTKATPAAPEHLINSTTPNFEEISQAALQRGQEAQAAIEPKAE